MWLDLSFLFQPVELCRHLRLCTCFWKTLLMWFKSQSDGRGSGHLQPFVLYKPASVLNVASKYSCVFGDWGYCHFLFLKETLHSEQKHRNVHICAPPLNQSLKHTLTCHKWAHWPNRKLIRFKYPEDFVQRLSSFTKIAINSKWLASCWLQRGLN